MTDMAAAKPIDLRFIEAEGAIKLKRCRAIWYGGWLYVWGKDKEERIECRQPKKVARKQWRVWISGVGYATLKRKCGCGVPLAYRTRSARRLLKDVL